MIKNGERGGVRTRDHRIKSPMLYQLSYPSTIVWFLQGNIIETALAKGTVV